MTLEDKINTLATKWHYRRIFISAEFSSKQPMQPIWLLVLSHENEGLLTPVLVIPHDGFGQSHYQHSSSDSFFRAPSLLTWLYLSLHVYHSHATGTNLGFFKGGHGKNSSRPLPGLLLCHLSSLGTNEVPLSLV